MLEEVTIGILWTLAVAAALLLLAVLVAHVVTRPWPLVSAAAISIGLTVGLLVSALWELPRLLVPPERGLDVKDRIAGQNGVRAAGATALFALGAALTAVSALRTYALSRQGQITERYTKAVEQIGSNEPSVNIGGIYALERLMRYSTDDHPTIMEVLAAYIRERTRPDNVVKGGTSPPKAEIQAALTVLRRRKPHRLESPLDLRGAVLTRAQLQAAQLKGAQLQEAVLTSAELQGANLNGAQLQDTVLVLAQLKHADLNHAQLSRAKLNSARLDGARLKHAGLQDVVLTRAGLQGAKLDHAHLQGAKLNGAELRGAKLKGAHLQEAELDAVSDWTNAKLTGAKIDVAGGLTPDDLRRAGARGVAKIQWVQRAPNGSWASAAAPGALPEG